MGTGLQNAGSAIGGFGSVNNGDIGQRRPLAMQKKHNQNYQRYMDKMNEALNKNIEKNIFP